MFKIGLVVLLTISLFLWVLPTLVKNYLVKNAKELVGTKIDVKDLTYNYFTSTLELHQFVLYNTKGSDTLVALDTLLLNLAPLQLISDKLEIEELQVTGLKVNTMLKDSVFNFEELIAFHTSTDSLPKTDETPLKYSISNIEFKKSKFVFDDRDVGAITQLNDIHFKIPFIGWDQKHKSEAHFKFEMGEDGTVESVLNFDPVQGSFDATLLLDKFSIAPFYNYTLGYAKINSLKGWLSSNIHLIGTFKNPIATTVYGKVTVTDFEMTDVFDKPLLAAQQIDCSLDTIDYYHAVYKIDSLKLKKPYVHFSLDTLSNNIFRAFKLYPKLKGIDSIVVAESDTLSNLYYAINHLKVEKGLMDYSDIHTGKLFEYHLNDISIHTDRIFSDAKQITIQSNMLLNNRGTLHATLGFNPLDFNNGVLDFRVENFLLSDINIYANHYMGHNVLKGDFYYYSHSKLTDGQIDSKNKLLVKNVSVKNQKKGLYNLPLKFALFLLKDTHGDVNLEVPVRGDLNDPEINIKKLIWTTFKNVLKKVVTQPVGFLTNLVGGKPKDLKEIQFSYLDTILSKKHKNQLEKLAKLEKKKEGLKINILYPKQHVSEKLLIAEELLGKQFNSQTQKKYQDNRTEFNEYLKNSVGTDTLSNNQTLLTLAKSLNIDSLANTYATIRANKMKKYLKQQSEFTQIKIKENDSVATVKTPNMFTFHVQYAVE